MKAREIGEDWVMLGSFGEMMHESEGVFDVYYRPKTATEDWVNVLVDARDQRRKKHRYWLSFSKRELRFSWNRDWNVMLEYDEEHAEKLLNLMRTMWRKKIEA